MIYVVLSYVIVKFHIILVIYAVFGYVIVTLLYHSSDICSDLIFDCNIFIS